MSDRTRRNLLDIIKKRAKKPFVKGWKRITGDPGDPGDPGKKLMITA